MLAFVCDFPGSPFPSTVTAHPCYRIQLFARFYISPSSIIVSVLDSHSYFLYVCHTQLQTFVVAWNETAEQKLFLGVLKQKVENVLSTGIVKEGNA